MTVTFNLKLVTVGPSRSPTRSQGLLHRWVAILAAPSTARRVLTPTLMLRLVVRFQLFALGDEHGDRHRQERPEHAADDDASDRPSPLSLGTGLFFMTRWHDGVLRGRFALDGDKS